ncbi:MAG: TonB-dependent receptor [Ginsengibacter sp.]
MKKLIYIFIITVISLHAKAQDCSMILTGHVHSTHSHEDLAKATVLLLKTGESITTDDNGDFKFTKLCKGDYTIKVTHASYDEESRHFSMDANRHIDIDLFPTKNVLKTVTITGINRPQHLGITKELSGKDLEETRGLSLAEALSKINGVSMLQTGSNISKPVIHGLHSNRILTINNGVRQEGQQWGNEHAPEIDPFIANELSVVKGVDELQYGSDAIGGVILVEPKSLRTLPGYNAEFNSMYFTNNREYVFSGIWEQQLKKMPSLTYRIQGTFKQSANVTTPHYRLNNTATIEKNFSATVGLRREHFESELYYSYFNDKVGIFAGSHIGNLTNLQKAIESDRPDPTFTGQDSYEIKRPYQAVDHHLVKSKSVLQVGANKFNLLVAAQLNSRKEFDIVRDATNNKPQMDLDIFTVSEDLNWEQPKRNNFSGLVGITAMQQDNSYAGRYFIPNYTSGTYGSYVIEKWKKNKWDAQAGLRFDQKKINTNRMLTNGTRFDFYSFNFFTFASSFNVGYQIQPTWKIYSNFSMAGRAPNVNELLSNGIHHGTATYEIGNIALKPEHSINISLNSDYNNKANTIGFDVTLYNNNINDFIYQQPKPDEPVLTIAGAFPKLVYEQTNANLKGLDFSAFAKPVNNLEWQLKYSMLRARNKKIDDWLIMMPADNITNELSWQFKDGSRLTKTSFGISIQNTFKQTRVPDDKYGKQDYKEPPPAYTLVDADFSTSFRAGSLPITLYLSGKNLLNTTYRNYLNSLRYFTDEIGRNISVRIKIGLQHFYE